MTTLSSVGSVLGPADAPSALHGAAPKPTTTAGLEKVAKDFEALMVHELLAAAKLGGEEGAGGPYQGMTVDALTSGIEHAGGLGLAAQLQQSLARRT
jgi:Rod binding domain-containing protein